MACSVNGAERLMVMLIIERREREVWVQRTRVAGGPGFSSLAGFGGVGDLGKALVLKRASAQRVGRLAGVGGSRDCSKTEPFSGGGGGGRSCSPWQDALAPAPHLPHVYSDLYMQSLV